MPIRESKSRTSNPHGAQNHSGFLITINTNRSPQSPAEEAVLGDLLRLIIGDLFDDTNVNRMFKFLNGPRQPSAIKYVDSEFAIEIGSVQKRVHAHILTNVYHNTRIHVDPLYLRDEVTSELNRGLIRAGLPGLRGKVYVNVKAVKGDFSVLKYVRKGVREI